MSSYIKLTKPYRIPPVRFAQGRLCRRSGSLGTSLLRLMERAAFHGVRSAGSAAAPRSMGGLTTFLTDNVVNAGGPIAKAHVDKIMEEVFMDGGHPDLLVMNPRVANQLRALLDNSSFVR